MNMFYIAGFIGVFIGFAVYAKKQQWSNIIAAGGGLILGMFSLLITNAIFNETPKQVTQPAGAIVVPAQAEIAPAPVQIDHYYVMQDGFAYGYQKVASVDDINAGIASAPLVMASYAGEKDGKHQVFTHPEGSYMVVECKANCEFLKIMSFDDVTGKFINSAHIKAEPGIIAVSMITDAANGKLAKFEPIQNGKTYNVWYDQQKGFTSTVVDK